MQEPGMPLGETPQLEVNPAGDHVTQQSPGEGWERIKDLFRTATSRPEPGERIPEAPEEVKEWGQNTMLGVFAGLLYGSGSEWVQLRREGGVTQPLAAPTKLHAARYIAEQKTQRTVRILNGGLRGGLTLGALAGTFYAVQTLSTIARGYRDFKDTGMAGVVAGALFGAIVPGAPGYRLRSMLLGAGLGGVIGIPAGMLQVKIMSMLPEDMRQQKAAWRVPTEPPTAASAATATGLPVDSPPASFAADSARKHDSTARVIAQLEASLAQGPAKSKDNSPD